MTTVTVQVKGAEALARRLNPKAIDRALRFAIDEMTKDVQSMMAVYPAEGDWNTPGPYPKRWYQRHWGPRWARKTAPMPGGYNTSEKLQKSWKRSKATLGKEGRVYTNVTYAPWVLHEEKQTAVHASHGWKTDRERLQEYQPKAERRVKHFLDRALAGSI